MKTEHLNYIIDLYKTQSLSKTAENFFTTRQSISNAIKTLEKEYGVKLLNRNYKGIEFTNEGQIFYRSACKIMEEEQKLHLKLSPFTDYESNALQGQLDIYIASRFSNKFFLKFYSNYASKNRKMELSLNTINPSTFFKNIYKNNFVYIISASSQTLKNIEFLEKLRQHNLTFRPIKKYNLGICARKNSKWKKHLENFCKEDMLERIPFAVFNYAIGDALNESIYLNSNLNMAHVISVDDFESQKILLKKDVCLSWATRNEYNMFFKTKDNAIEFYMNPYCDDLNFFYCALFPKENSAILLIDNFLDEFKKSYC